MSAPVLEIANLSVAIKGVGDRPHAVRGINLTVGSNEIVCVVGESGSGKSVTALSVMRLVVRPACPRSVLDSLTIRSSDMSRIKHQRNYLGSIVKAALTVVLALQALSSGRAMAEPLIGLTTTGNLVTFDSATPGTVVPGVAITGLQTGETLLGIDRRPANGVLYGLGSTSRIYTINTVTGLATSVGITPFAPALSGTAFGFDFNPVPDRIRVVSTDTSDFRLNPNDGTLAGTDTPLSYAVGDSGAGLTPRVVGSARLGPAFQSIDKRSRISTGVATRSPPSTADGRTPRAKRALWSNEETAPRNQIPSRVLLIHRAFLQLICRIWATSGAPRRARREDQDHAANAALGLAELRRDPFVHGTADLAGPFELQRIAANRR
jgi:energy-coupling factor transporter ATP-binding protein EcfA2